MPKLIDKILESKDFASGILLTVILVAAVWIAALPFSSSVQDAYLRRFHLASPNFAAWAIQQPIPAMYNFDNRVWASEKPLNAEQLENAMSPIGQSSASTPSKNSTSIIETDAVNHFPTRSFTFGHSRSFLKQNPSWNFYLRTRYRGREIRSAFQILFVSESEVRVERREVSFD